MMPFNPLYSNGFLPLVWCNELGIVQCICLGVSGFNLKKKILKISFTVTNRVDPDEMPHNAAFHLGLHCL